MSSRSPDSSAGPLLRIKADDGCTLAVHQLRQGETGAVPFLLVHALAMDGMMWADVADALPPGAPVYAVDCRGHGLSDKPAGPYTTARFARDLGLIIGAINAPRVHLVGWSMGGTIALAFAGTYPQRVASLSIVDGTATYGPEAPPAWEARAQKAVAGGMQALMQFQLDRWFTPAFLEAQPAKVQNAVATFNRNSVPAYVETCRMLGSADERAALKNYTGPCAVVVGEEDYATPVAMAQEIASLIKGAQITVLPKVRHFTPIEVPEKIAACIAAIARA
ncbi:MAG TPA: alpha/beta fold hydrolase [Burkholderiales bacterium]|nr:alpha/beta fold hydrolase [Burkholderiales bacterium]